MKTFMIEFLCFPGLEVHCKICEVTIKERQEEVIIPTLYMGKQYAGPICKDCYRDLPNKINISRLPRFEG